MVARQFGRRVVGVGSYLVGFFDFAFIYGHAHILVVVGGFRLVLNVVFRFVVQGVVYVIVNFGLGLVGVGRVVVNIVIVGIILEVEGLVLKLYR